MQTDRTFRIKSFYGLLSFCYQIGNLIAESPVFVRVYATLDIIPTPQIALHVKQFCLGDLSCGISIIHFVLYCTWLLMLRYHSVSTFDNELCNLWRQCVPGGLLLTWYYSAVEVVCQEVFYS